MTIMIKIPNGRVAFDQHRRITETTQTITINDNVTISLSQSLRKWVDIIQASPEKTGEDATPGAKTGTSEAENPENPHHS